MANASCAQHRLTCSDDEFRTYLLMNPFYGIRTEQRQPVEPMKPMKPMEPMKPVEPMKPMQKPAAWWPEDLGEPSSSGGQNDLRYAFFPDKHRLLIQQHGAVTTYDSGDRAIRGVSQASGSGGPTFESQNGTVDLSELKKLS